MFRDLKMPIYLLIVLFFFLLKHAPGQELVKYMHHQPVIDGYRDELFKSFKLIPLSNFVKSQDANSDFESGFFVAYNANFLYLYMETDGDSITIRDRAYQNGDGFHLMIGNPKTDNTPTDEFYVLGFSPENSWCHQIVWYYNIDLKMSRLSSDTKFETGCMNGKICYELLLPWKDIYPYHPWFYDRLGFNLCLVKAIGEKEKNYYFLKRDEKFQCELSEREYLTLDFEPIAGAVFKYSSQLKKNHIKEQGALVVTVAGYTSCDTTAKITISIISGENATLMYHHAKLNFGKGYSNQEIILENHSLIPGGYKAKVHCGKDLIGEHYFSVFPSLNLEELRMNLQEYRAGISPGSYHTLFFYLNDIDSALLKLKDYENSFMIRNRLAEILLYIMQLQSGSDPFDNKKGIYRRAYLSEEDNKVYPYSVYVPGHYTVEKKYPLLVYLHGSGEDDRVLLNTSVIEEGFIVLAPNGRGTSNCYTGSEPQTDIEESIRDVVANYNIDTSKIILSGFSMGGYGVFRTFYEHPERYKAIAVFSGHPDLGRKWIGPDEPNFLDKNTLSKFSGIPVYIYHGKDDLNCPFNITEELVEKLQKNNCHVTFEVDESGHGNLSPEILEKYHAWLNSQLSD